MINVSQAFDSPPESFKTPLQQKVYETLDELHIPYLRVDTDEAITMADCDRIGERLQARVVKTLFLCNRQQTMFYLFVTDGSKPFSTKAFSAAMDISRVSFSPTELMQPMLGTTIGATTVFSVLAATARDVRLVFDGDALRDEWYGCSDGTTTGYMKLRTDDLVNRFLPHAGRAYTVIDV